MRHLKCDGAQPTCSRCAHSGGKCIFVASRRGFNGTRSSDIWHDTASPSPIVTNLTDGILPSYLIELPPPTPFDMPGALSEAHHSIEARTATTTSPLTRILSERNIALYYQNFHPAHPFIIPERLYRQDPDVLPRQLKKVMCLAASCQDGMLVERLELSKYLEAYSSDNVGLHDAFRVQILILIGIISYAYMMESRGHASLHCAFELASAIGLDQDDYAITSSQTWRESWLRTWWELYSLGILASSVTGFSLSKIRVGRQQLPGSCAQYSACQSQDFRTMPQMKSRFTSLTEHEWSSFAYGIEASSLLTEVLHLVEDYGHSQSSFAGAQTRLATLLAALPPSRATCTNSLGGPDEVMFRALVTIHTTTIHIYLALSGQPLQNSFTQCHTQHIGADLREARLYQATALRSANEISRLLSARAGFSSMSPCISCAIALSATVQVQALTEAHNTSQTSILQDYLNLHHVVLDILSARWPIARTVRLQMIPLSTTIVPVHNYSGDSSSFEDNVLRPLELLDNIMEDDDLWLNQTVGGQSVAPDTISAVSSISRAMDVTNEI